MRQLSLMLFVLSLSSAALADEDGDDAGVAVAVQNREFSLRHELTLSGGLLPLDAFYKGITGQVSYTFHFNDHFAWQVGRAAFSYNLHTNLREQLLRDFGVQATKFPEVSWYAGSDLLWTPAYGKVALMNWKVVHLELFLLGGGSAVGVVGDGVKPAVNVGGGLRFFTGQSTSLRLEVANNFVLGKDPFNVLTINLGVAFNFGGGGRG